MKPKADPRLRRCKLVRDSAVGRDLWLKLIEHFDYGTQPALRVPALLGAPVLDFGIQVAPAGLLCTVLMKRDLRTCSIDAEGRFLCSDARHGACPLATAQICEHLCALLVWLVIGGALPAERALALAVATQGRFGLSSPGDLDALKVQLSTAPAVDWRPAETLPEDHYAL